MNLPPLEALPRIPRDAEGPVFREPWEAEAFALAVALHRAGTFTWTEWAAALADEIAGAKAAGDPDLGDTYYRHWLAALEKLVADGRIHPGRIEEVVEKARKEVDASIIETGEQAAYEVGVHGLHPEMIKLIGRMKWRTSYGQNILYHSKETAFLAGIMAAELGLDVAMAKRGALLHDVGKVLTHDHEGTHVQLGVEVATKYGEHPLVVNCIAAHHDDVPHESEVSVLVQAADAISGSRPGARREAFETYVKRLEGLEKIASSYKGVDRVFAIQAGREVRVIVDPSGIDDARMQSLTEEIARRVESELQYPGQIRVVAIRETRASDIAR